MIYRCTFTEVEGVRYLAGYQLVSERGRPSADDELPAAPGPVLTEDGRYRWRLVANPEHGKGGDARRYMLEDNPQPAPAELAEAKAQHARRAALAAALPDILLAVADGADLRDELKRVLQEAQHGER